MAPGVNLGRVGVRRLLVGILAVGIVGVVGATVGLAIGHRGLTGEIALEATTAGQTSATVSAVDIEGASTVHLALPTRALSRAPTPTDLGVFPIPAGSYARLSVHLGARAVSVPVQLSVPASGLTPLLLAVRGDSVTAYAGNDAVNLGLQLAGGRLTAIPDITFTDQNGRQARFSTLQQHRITVVAAFLTHCHESCPVYTAVLADLEKTLAQRGWADRVTVLEVTMDPERDTPDVLTAYARMTGATWPLLTADPSALRSFWDTWHATYEDVPYTGTPPIDWYTGQPETHDVRHTSMAAIVDPQGYSAFILQGDPRLGHALSTPLATLLAPDAAAAAASGQHASWTLTDLLDRVDTLANLPGEAARAPETAVRTDAAAPTFSLPSLGGADVALADQRSHPVLLNFWATWCVPCRRELPLLAGVARQHPALRLLAVDEGESAADVQGFLHDVVGGTPPFTVLLDGQTSVGDRYSVVGLPVTVAIDAGGVVRWVHVGELSAALVDQALAAAGVS